MADITGSNGILTGVFLSGVPFVIFLDLRDTGVTVEGGNIRSYNIDRGVVTGLGQ